MREIKFRAWDKIDKLMYRDVQTGINFDDGSYYAFFNFLGEQEIDDYHQWEVMQFTGLHDKNGKEIYEGDIVQPDYAEELFKISFHDGGFVLEGIDDVFNQCEANTCQIKGTIYENPELLK